MAALPACATETWPPRWMLGEAGEMDIGGNLSWDAVRYDGTGTQTSAHGLRRAEIGVGWTNGDSLEAGATWDAEAKTWADVFIRWKPALADGAPGNLRFGQFRVPVGMEGSASSRISPLMETALPTQALLSGRRLGAEWEISRPAWQLRAGAFAGGDLQGGQPGSTLAVRAGWAPYRREHGVLHLGVSSAIERSQKTPGQAGGSLRLRARPGDGLGEWRVLDSGTFTDIRTIRRHGLEGAWIHGPVSLQGEWLQLHATRHAQAAIRGQGHTLLASWVLTGESRPWLSGQIGNLKPASPLGALEVLLRHDRVQLLGSAPERTARSLTVGANWYVSAQWRLQVNHVRARSVRPDSIATPQLTEVRAHWYF